VATSSLSNAFTAREAGGGCAGEHAAGCTGLDDSDSHRSSCVHDRLGLVLSKRRKRASAAPFVVLRYSTGLVGVPLPSITILTVLPGFIEPTPIDVPQTMTSPA